MAENKRITLDWDATGLTVYCIIRRETDNFRMDDADGSFAESPADPYIDLTEDAVIKGRYELDESRTVWDNGRYSVAIYNQAGGSPVPVSDIIIGTGELAIENDSEVFLSIDMARVLGLVMENLVEEVATRDSNGNKLTSTIYLYDSAVNATTHDKITGLKATYDITASYTSNLMDLFKSIKAS